MPTQNYHTIKNAALITPATATDLGSASQPYGNLYLQGNITLNNATTITSTSAVNPKITSVTYPGSATAADPAGGQTITINGSGFASGATTYVAGVIISVTNFVSSTQLTFTSPAKTAGSYTLSVVNTDGGTASYIPGLTYSALPVWSTSAGSLGSSYTGSAISTINLSASENAQSITYAVTSGTLPTGLSLSSSGALTGTPTGSAATYNFTVTATDPQNQTASRNFSYTVMVVYTSATGGTITTDGNYKVHTFTTSGSFVVTVATSTPIDYLVVGGGGSGGGGGGGAGGVLIGTATLANSTTYTMTVGGGGSDSSIAGTGLTTITAYAGGSGGSGNGASGGGSNSNHNSGGSQYGGIGIYPGSSYISGPRQGYDGGDALVSSGYPAEPSGGGGAGGKGGGSSRFGPSSGGPGITSSISGLSTYYGGGGGGMNTFFDAGYAGSGGAGGGGSGYYGMTGSSHAATSGSTNTGGGGGGGGGSGGSGIIIVRYQYQ